MDAAGADFRLEAAYLGLVGAQQGEIPVVGQAQPLEQGAEAAAAGGLLAAFNAGDGGGLADALAELPLSQALVLPFLADVCADGNLPHGWFLSFYTG